jgi:hypothetical protein
MNTVIETFKKENPTMYWRKIHFILITLFPLISTIAEAQLAFEPKVAFPTGNEPNWIASGDLDGDGDIDLVTANSATTTISVLKNNGNATFVPHVTYTVGSRPVAVALGDIDGDSDLDAVTANQNTNNVSVLRNNGNGTFAAQTLYALGSSPASVILSDVDNDNDLDIAAGRFDSVAILRNAGGGTFLPAVSYPVAGSIQGIAAGDLDGDGDRDLVAARLHDSIAVLKNNGNGTFQSPVSFSILPGRFSKRVALADFDADSDLDVVSANQNAVTTSVLFNNGDGSFGAATTFQTGDMFTFGMSVEARDMNEDGSPDIIIANGGNAAPPTVSVLINRGNGTFRSALNVGMLYTRILPFSPLAVTVADFDGDGHRDIAASGVSYGSAVALALNRPAIFDYPVDYPTGTAPTSIASADFDGDNDKDIVVVNNGSGTFSIRLNNGNGTFAPAVSYSAGVSPYAVSVGDFDNDSDVDLVVTQNVISFFPLKVFWNNGAGAFPSGTVIDGVTLFADAVYVSNADVDADGDQDIVSGNLGVPNWIVRNNGNQTFTASNLGSGWPNYYALLADVDGDGDKDYVGPMGNYFSVRKNNGNGTFMPEVFTEIGYQQWSLTLADFDGDTDLDIATALNSTGWGIRMLNSGNGTFSSPDTFAHGGGNQTKVISGDFDGDGDKDLAYASYSASNVTIMTNNGSGSFSVPVAYAAGSGPRAITAQDFDGDGDLDLAIANETSNDVSILFNRTVSVGVSEEHNNMPQTFQLWQNYPNPFNPSTTIRFEVGGSGEGGSGFKVQGSRLVTLKVYDVLGREVATMVNEKLQPGTYEVKWDASHQASGLYFYRLVANEVVLTKKMLLLR